MAEPVLKGPDFAMQLLVQTDTSDIRVGAVLNQLTQPHGDRPVAFFFQKLLSQESHYAAVEKKCLAIIEAVKHFTVYLAGVCFYYRNDHNCLRYLSRMKDTGRRQL